MADNVTANAGSGGATFASDDISSIQYPRVKITLGADGVNDGDVSSSNPIPITGTVSVSGTVSIGTNAITSVVPGTGATNLGKAIGNASGATDTGVSALALRDDALSTLSDAENDWVPLRVDSTGALWVRALAGAAQYIDDADWTVGSSEGVAVLGIHDALDTTRTPTSGDVAGFSLDPNANQRVVLPTLRKLTASFVRPGNTTAYIANGAVANSTTAGSVSLLNFGIPKSAGTITRARMKHSATGDDPQWRVWLFDTTLTPAVGDNATFTAPLTDSLGYIDIDGSTDGTDVEVGWASATIPHTGATVFGLIQTRSAWTPASSETITLDLWSYPG